MCDGSFPPPGPEPVRGLGAHEPPALVVVLAREEPFERHVDEVWVTVKSLSVGERELRALDDGVDEVGAAEPERA